MDKGQTYIDRGMIILRRRLRAALSGFTPSGIKGKLIGPRVLMNSIPKSGTNLLESALNNFPLLRNAGRRTIMDWDAVSEPTLSKIKKIRKGQFVPAHLPAHRKIISLLATEGIKSLCMIRDPRDIVVSSFKYITNIDLTHVTHKHFFSLPNDDARLMAAIKGLERIHASIGEVLLRYEGWLDAEKTLTVRFEDLVGSRGGGDDARQYETVLAIAKHLEIDLTEDRAKEICNRTFSTKSPTFRAGAIGNWRKYFKEEHIKAFKESAGSLIVKYGYGNSNDW